LTECNLDHVERRRKGTNGNGLTRGNKGSDCSAGGKEESQWTATESHVDVAVALLLMLLEAILIEECEVSMCG
jgi:hypothetical protein